MTNNLQIEVEHPTEDYLALVNAALEELGINKRSLIARNLPIHPEARSLCLAEVTYGGREHRLLPEVAETWHQVQAAAIEDGIELYIVSAYRSFERQLAICRAKLARGLDIETILSVTAPPGYSEHHTGRAIDVGTTGCKDLEEAFEKTPAFRWLSANAHKFGFLLSYPRNNVSGYAHEPWHWFWRANDHRVDGDACLPSR